MTKVEILQTILTMFLTDLAVLSEKYGLYISGTDDEDTGGSWVVTPAGMIVVDGLSWDANRHGYSTNPLDTDPRIFYDDILRDLRNHNDVMRKQEGGQIK